MSTRRIGPRCQPSPGMARNAKAFARGPCWSRRWRGMTREGPELKLGGGFGLGRHADHSRAAIMPRSAMACHRGDSYADSTVRTAQLHKASAQFGGDTESKRARFSERKTLEKRRSLSEWRSMATCCGQGRSTAAHGTAAMQIARRHRPSSATCDSKCSLSSTGTFVRCVRVRYFFTSVSAHSPSSNLA